MPELRDKIIELLQGAYPDFLRLNQLAVQLGIYSDTKEYEQLRTALDDMVTEGLLNRSSRRRYSLAGTDESVFQGELTIRNFSGVVHTSNPQVPVINVKRAHLHTALNGDTVEVQLHSFDRKNRASGEISKVIERKTSQFSGKIDHDGDFYFLVPNDEKIHVDFLIHPKNLNKAGADDKVIVELVRWDDPFKSPEARVIDIIGVAGDPGVEYESIAREFHLTPEFPRDVERELKQFPTRFPASEYKLRKDCRELDIVTIDPDDARDFDDALSLEWLDNGNARLGVHIADVSYYVQAGTKLDQEAAKRGNSTYLVNGVIPMLPELLSNNLCSLVPNRVRPAYSVFIEITPRGAIKGYNITETVIKSKQRFTYGQAQDIIEGNDTKHKFKNLILELHKVATLLRKKRVREGGIEFETSEVRFKLDDNNIPISAELKSRTDATSLVEECMLLANRTVAKHIETISPKKNGKRNMLPFVYRVHDTPDPERIEAAIELIRAYGVDVPSGEVTTHVLNSIIEQVHDKPEKNVINQVLLRSMAKAVYHTYNTGHYGLGFSHYAHFTSPIRRYPDLLVHRALKEYADEIPDGNRVSYLKAVYDAAAHHCSATERNSVDAERASSKLAQATMVRDKVGEECFGIVTGVASFGLFVQLDNYYAEGLVKLRDLNDDYYYFDERKLSLVGRRKGTLLRMGTRVKVQIAAVKVEKREIDFLYLGLENPPTEEEQQQFQKAKELAATLSKKKHKKKRKR